MRLSPALAIIDKNLKSVGKEVSQRFFTAILSIAEETIILATALILSLRLGFPAFLLALLSLILTTCTQQPPKDARHFHYLKKPVITLLNYTNIAIFAHTLGVAGNWELRHCS